MFQSKIHPSISGVVVATLLSGCQWLTQPVATDVQYISVPRSLYPSCDMPVRDYNTIGERIMWGDDVAENYAVCISDVNALVDYLEETRSEDDTSQ